MKKNKKKSKKSKIPEKRQERQIPPEKRNDPKLVSADVFIKKLEPLGIETKEDKTGNIRITLKGIGTITYIARRHLGFKYQMKKRDSKGKLNWFGSGGVWTEEQIEEMVSSIKDYKKSKNSEILIKLGFLDKSANVKK